LKCGRQVSKNEKKVTRISNVRNAKVWVSGVLKSEMFGMFKK
jgi:hypothetical protein